MRVCAECLVYTTCYWHAFMVKDALHENEEGDEWRKWISELIVYRIKNEAKKMKKKITEVIASHWSSRSLVNGDASVHTEWMNEKNMYDIAINIEMNRLRNRNYNGTKTLLISINCFVSRLSYLTGLWLIHHWQKAEARSDALTHECTIEANVR